MFHPMVAGVTIPGVGLGCSRSRRYVDKNPSNKPTDRKFAIALFTHVHHAVGGARHHRLVLPGPGLQLRVPLERRHLLRAVGASAWLILIVVIVVVVLAARLRARHRAPARQRPAGSSRETRRRTRPARRPAPSWRRSTSPARTGADSDEDARARPSRHGAQPSRACRQVVGRDRRPVRADRRGGARRHPPPVLQPRDPHRPRARRRRVRCRVARVPVADAAAGGFGSEDHRRQRSTTSTPTSTTRCRSTTPAAKIYIQRVPEGRRRRRPRRSTSRAIVAGMEQGFVALYQKCPHLGCRVPWCQTSQWFECPCHGSKYNRVGEKQGGPAPRGMDRFPLEVSRQQHRRRHGGTVVQGPPIGTDTTGQGQEGAPWCDPRFTPAVSFRTIADHPEHRCLRVSSRASSSGASSACGATRSDEQPRNLTPFLPDEDLEGRRLERVLGWSLLFTLVIAIALPAVLHLRADQVGDAWRSTSTSSRSSGARCCSPTPRARSTTSDLLAAVRQLPRRRRHGRLGDRTCSSPSRTSASTRRTRATPTCPSACPCRSTGRRPTSRAPRCSTTGPSSPRSSRSAGRAPRCRRGAWRAARASKNAQSIQDLVNFIESIATDSEKAKENSAAAIDQYREDAADLVDQQRDGAARTSRPSSRRRKPNRRPTPT